MQKYVVREDLHTAGHIEAQADYRLQRWWLPRNFFHELQILTLLLTKSLLSLLFRRKQCIRIPLLFKKKKPTQSQNLFKELQLMHHSLFVIPNCNPGHKCIIKHTFPELIKKITEIKIHIWCYLKVQRHRGEIQKSYQYVDNCHTDLREQGLFYLLDFKTCRRGRKLGMCSKCWHANMM